MLFMFRTFRLHPKWWLAANFYLRFIFLLEIKSMEDVTVHKGHELCGICFHLGASKKLGDVFGTFNSLTWWHQQPQRDCWNACFWASPPQTYPATWRKLAVTQPSKTGSKHSFWRLPSCDSSESHQQGGWSVPAGTPGYLQKSPARGTSSPTTVVNNSCASPWVGDGKLLRI